MNIRYIIRGILIGSIFSMIIGGLKAQEDPSIIDTSATILPAANVPGRLFNSTNVNNTGAISTVSGEVLYKTAVSNVSNTLYGLLPGLTVTQGSGEPGNDNAKWIIRGIGSYGFGGYNVCKFFVDGFEVNSNYFVNLAAAEIESVSVLKDAASLATFGMRGANGIIWIETKRGKIGKSTVQVNFRSGVQQAESLNKPLDSYNYASLYNQAVSNDYGRIWTPKYSDVTLAAYKNGTGTNVDWYDQVFKNSGSYTNGDVIFNGGNSGAKYNIVFDYVDQKGLYNVDNSDQTSNLRHSKYSVRANLDFSMLNIFEAKVDIGGRIEERKRPNFATSDLMNNLVRYPSNIYKVYDDTTSTHFSGTSVYPNNPVASIRGLGWYSSHARILQGNFSLKEKLDFITKGLYMKEAFSFNSYTLSTYSKTKNYARYTNGATTTTDQTTTIVASGYGSGGMEDWKQGILTLGYERQFGLQTITSAINFHQSDFKGDGFFGYKYHYRNYSGRFNYNYNNRYIAEIGFSYFGNDAYAPGNRWGLYPALSAAWIISNESFLKSNPVINYLKVRTSVGKTGGSDTGATGSFSAFSSNGRYLYQQYYGSGRGQFYTGNSTPTQAGTLAPLFIPNQDIFAEQSIKYNLGTDITLIKKLDLSLDLYLDKRSNIVTLDNSFLGYYGNNDYFSNIGKMTNKGFEVSGIWSDKIGGVGYSLNAMASYSKNKIDYMGEVTPAFPYNARTGRAFGVPIGMQAIGFFQTSDFDANGSLKSGIPIPAFGAVQPGDIRYKDLNSDGYIDQTDITAIGKSPYPELTYSFGGSVNYKRFDLSILLQGTSGSSVNLLDAAYPQVVAFIDNGNAYEIAKGAWAYYPDQGIDTRATATYPRLTTLANANNFRSSSLWMKSGDFLRIRNIELGYNLAPQLLSKLGISKARIFVNATNPVTWSSLLKDYNIDPETMSGYPGLKSVNAGISVTF